MIEIKHKIETEDGKEVENKFRILSDKSYSYGKTLDVSIPEAHELYKLLGEKLEKIKQ